MSLKTALRSGFVGCHVIAHARDEHRDRDVRIFYYPGDFDFVGVHDGTDTWIAPVSADPFSVNLIRVMQELRSGKPLHEIKVQRKRVPLVVAEAPAPAEPAPRPRIPLLPVRPRNALKAH